MEPFRRNAPAGGPDRHHSTATPCCTPIRGSPSLATRAHSAWAGIGAGTDEGLRSHRQGTRERRGRSRVRRRRRERRRADAGPEGLRDHPADHDPERAGRLVHGLRLRDVHRQARFLLRHCGTGGVQPDLGPGGRDVRLLPAARGLRLRADGMAGPWVAQRDLGPEPDPELAGHVRRNDEGLVPGHRDRRHLRRPRGSREPRVRGSTRAGAHHGAGEPHPSRAGRGELPRRQPRGRAGGPRPGPGRGRRGSTRRGHPARQEGRPAGGLRRDPQPRGGGGQAVHRALPDPAADHPGRQGHRLRGSSAVRRSLLRQRSLECLEGVPRSRRRPRGRQRLQPARHVQLPRRPLHRQDADPRQHLRHRDRQGLQGGPRAGLRRPLGDGSAVRRTGQPRSARSRRSRSTDRTGRSGRSRG